MDDDGLPNARPIALSDSPRCQRSQSSVVSAAVKPRKYPRPIAVHSFPFQDRVLRRPVETTAKSGYHGRSLFDQFVCELLEMKRHLQPQRFGRPEVDNKLIFRRRLYRHVGWLLAL